MGVFDADVHGPSLPTQAEPGASVAPSLANPDVMVPVESGGMKLMSFGFIQGLWSAGDAIDTRGGGAAGELAVQLLHTTKWGALDYLVIDTPPGTGEIPRALAARAHYAGAVVVTTPSDLAVADVVRGVALLRKFDVPILGVVENMATFQCGCGEVHRPFGTGAGPARFVGSRRSRGVEAAPRAVQTSRPRRRRDPHVVASPRLATRSVPRRRR